MNKNKTCNTCKETKSVEEFVFRNKDKGYRSPYCKPCLVLLRKSRYNEKAAEKRKIYYQKNKSRVSKQCKKWRQENRSRIFEKNKEYIKTEACSISQRKYRRSKNGRSIKNANLAKYRSAKLQRTPSWTDLEKIKEIYKNCPKGYHVDHIIPLQGETVSGFHIPENLQYLTASENSSKGNRI